MRAHELTIARMAERCRQIGRKPDEAGWRERSWPIRSQRALDDIAEVIPASMPFILIDGGRLGVEPAAGAATRAHRGRGRRHRPTPKPTSGRPTRGDLAVFPWLDAMPGVQTEIRTSYRPLRENSRLRIYTRR